MTDDPSILTVAARTWRGVAHDWQAVFLGLAVVLVVSLGVSIPW